ncbi:1928_t:CDS:2 [Paraglomus occultum]|uniref:1928_t:CDS:1 n=1 Tax=Paraglomus occultum TaxID=144539 RepID=A0A9N9AQ29_9GLOM|nr:1928_t:CDS:2 [Paraglomus occultum]
MANGEIRSDIDIKAVFYSLKTRKLYKDVYQKGGQNFIGIVSPYMKTNIEAIVDKAHGLVPSIDVMNLISQNATCIPRLLSSPKSNTIGGLQNCNLYVSRRDLAWLESYRGSGFSLQRYRRGAVDIFERKNFISGKIVSKMHSLVATDRVVNLVREDSTFWETAANRYQNHCNWTYWTTEA